MKIRFSKQKGVLLTLLVLVHLFIFELYVQPDFLVTIANQVWACF